MSTRTTSPAPRRCTSTRSPSNKGTAAHPRDLAFARLDLARVEAELGKWQEVKDLVAAAGPALDAPEDLAEAKNCSTARPHTKTAQRRGDLTVSRA